MDTYTLDITTFAPGWKPGDSIPDVRVLDALAGQGITATYTAVDAVTGTVTMEASADPSSALAGLTIGPTPAEQARSQAISDYAAAVVALRGATVTAEVVAAVKGWERATTNVLKLIVHELGGS